MLRIIGGKYRGKKLFSPENKDVRPTAERAREAIFSILYSKLGDFGKLRVLDIFAGTGAFGLEALSRGAEKVSFIDQNTFLVTKNTALFEKEKSHIKIIRAEASNLPYASETHNLIFADAPYQKGLSEKAAESLLAKGWIENGALCLFETAKDEDIFLPSCFKKVDERFYGAAKINFYICENDALLSKK